MRKLVTRKDSLQKHMKIQKILPQKKKTHREMLAVQSLKCGTAGTPGHIARDCWSGATGSVGHGRGG